MCVYILINTRIIKMIYNYLPRIYIKLDNLIQINAKTRYIYDKNLMRSIGIVTVVS